MKTTREEALFALALERPAEKRAAFLEVMCEGDAALRARLEALLAAHEQPETALGGPGEGATRPTIHAGIVEIADEAVGQTLGRYKLLEKIGEGGCGVVYVAEQTEPVRRRVALKVIKLGMDTKQVVARFEAERQALAMMDHPNIAKVLDAGTTEGSAGCQPAVSPTASRQGAAGGGTSDSPEVAQAGSPAIRQTGRLRFEPVLGAGRPYFVMELVRGIKITDYCDRSNLSTKERLDLFIKICQAIQHAHQKGIIHRDVKPSNILVTLHDGVPVPKVIDFGIAKATEGRLTDATVYTQLHQFIGTPAYMSPEQAEMSGLDIDTRSDIYSLGVLLYELLTGKTPFDANELVSHGLDAMRKTIREKEPLRPSTRLATLKAEEQTTTAKRRSSDAPKLIHLLKGDLDWIVMKCLEKDRTRRYETANGVAADLKRHLNHEPVTARPPSTMYRVQKAWRRNKLAFTAAAAVATALVCGILVSAWQAVRATRAEREQVQLRTSAESARAGEAAQRQQAEAAQANEMRLRKRAQLEAYAADMKAAQVAIQQNNAGQAADLLDRYRPAPGDDDPRGIEWRYLWHQTRGDETYVWRHPSMVVGARFSPDGRTLVTACFDGLLRVWDVSSRRMLTQFDRGVRDDHYIGSFRFSPDGRTLASAHRDGFIVFDTSSWQVVQRLEDPTGSSRVTLTYSPDGRLLAAATPAGLRVWDTTDWHVRTASTSLWSRSISFTPDGSALVVGTQREGIQLWDVSTFKRTRLAMSSFYSTESFELSKDASRLLTAYWTGELRMQDFQTGALIWSNRLHRASVVYATLSPDGKTVATSSFDQLIHLLDASTGDLQGTLRGHLNEVWSVEFSSDNHWLVSSGKDGTARLWDLQRLRVPRELWLPRNRWISQTLGPEGFLLVSSTTNGVVQFWSGSNVVRTVDRDMGSVNWKRMEPTPDGSRLFQLFTDGSIRIREAAGSARETVLNTSTRPDELGNFSRDGQRLSVWTQAPNDEWVLEVLDTTSGKSLVRIEDSKLPTALGSLSAFSHDGTLLAYGATNFVVKVWDLALGHPALTLTGHVWHINDVSFSSDGRLLASSSWDGDARIWDLRTGKPLAGPLRGHGSGVVAVTFSSDGKTLVTAGDDNTVRFWQVATGREMLVVPQSNAAVADLLSPTGDRLVVWDTARQAVRVERIPTLTEIAVEETGRNAGGQKP